VSTEIQARRLLNINNYAYRRGGAETVFLGHADMFSEAGLGVDLFAMKHPSNPQGMDETYFTKLIDLEHMPGRLQKAEAAAAIIYNHDARQNLERLIKARKPDVAHAHNIYHHISPAILPLLKSYGVPTVLTAHDLKLACPSYKMLSNGVVCERCKGGKIWNTVSERCLKSSLPLSGLIAVESAIHKSLGLYRRNLDRIVAPSQFYKRKLEEWGWPADMVRYIPNFVADTPVEPGQGGSGAILYFGRLSDEKGISTLIRAAAQAKTPVNIAGTGPLADELKQLALDLAAPVTFLGYRQGADLAELIATAEAIALPSEWYENAPMSVLEAYLHGRPVAGANIGGIPELIVEGETGWLFPSGDQEALAAILRQVFDTPPAIRSTMGRAGGDLVRREFSRAAYRQRVLELYGELLG